MIIKVIQKKDNKPIVIPVLPKVREIFGQGLLYSVSTLKLNKHFKTLGEKAGIDKSTMGRLKEKVDKVGLRGVKRVRPKWM
ncbi:site-specific integrase [Maribacter ulvicola]|uniref:Uncharacterized protein n=1 Tax=Maribacter ulvicola TaxID=228959 RepID=A0A1N6QFB4_9FLAO|nr:hypothetical protein [Maribacter ulvicola]SIQ15277.1 hypothetical protein SAMN05421797_101869 [Maribacter ulvicola]